MMNRDEQTFNIKHINPKIVVRSILKNFWIVILTAMSFAFIAKAVSNTMYTPTYTSTATFVISAKGSTSAYTSLTMANEMTQVFAQVFQSEVLRDKISAQMGGEKLTDTIQTQVIPETNLLRVSVTSTNPKKAYSTLGLIIENYPSISENLFANAVLEVIKMPDIPTFPSSLSLYQRYGKLLFLGGAVLSLGLIIAITILRGTIHNTTSARHNIDGMLIGTVPHEIKNKTGLFSLRGLKRRKNAKKVSVLITNALSSFKFTESYHSIRAKLSYIIRKRSAKVILITSACENEGKTTASANIALSFADRGKNVLLIDCDFKKPSLRKVFDIGTSDASDFAGYISSDADSYEPLYKNGIHLAANVSSHAASQKIIHSKKLIEYVNSQRSQRDVIIIDSPPMLVASDAVALMKTCDMAVLVVRQDTARCTEINDCIDKLSVTDNSFCGYIFNDCI